MKNKRQLTYSPTWMDFLMTYGWAFLAAIIVIGVLAYIGVFSMPEFTIYKQKCRNETGYNRSLIDLHSEINNKIDNIYNEQRYYEWCDKSIEYNLNISYCEGFIANLSKLIKEQIELEIEIENNPVITQKCEQVEVDEIEICEKSNECGYKDYSECFQKRNVERCINELEKKEPSIKAYNNKEWDYILCCKTWNKSQITQKWLDENCECKGNCPAILKYKCGGYTVEVN